MELEKDNRFRQLSTASIGFTFIALVLSLASVTSNQWAILSGPLHGYFGPFLVCQNLPGASDRCENGGLGPYKQSIAAYIAGGGAILCVLFLAVAIILGPIVVAMHYARHQIFFKFRHIVIMKLIVTSSAAFCSFISWISFLLEAKVFVKMQTDESGDLGWSFYLQMTTCLISIFVGVMASYEWRWSRKLGGDPTVYSRDPEGTKADTIINQNFRDAPGTAPASRPKEEYLKALRTEGRSVGGDVQRNINGIAMTQMSGLPYVISTNETSRNGTSRNGSLRRQRRPNGHTNFGLTEIHTSVRKQPPRLPDRTIIPYDPSRTPLRSSLKRPKRPPPSQIAPLAQSEDGTDLTVSQVVRNPTFASSSPPTPKKTVRIHTQSTAV